MEKSFGLQEIFVPLVGFTNMLQQTIQQKNVNNSLKQKKKTENLKLLLAQAVQFNCPLGIGYFPSGVSFYGRMVKKTDTHITLVGYLHRKIYCYSFDYTHVNQALINLQNTVEEIVEIPI